MTDDELARALLMTIGPKRLGVDIERPEDWMAIDVVEDALARGEAEILAAYARRRLKRAAQELAKEAQTK